MREKPSKKIIENTVGCFAIIGAIIGVIAGLAAEGIGAIPGGLIGFIVGGLVGHIVGSIIYAIYYMVYVISNEFTHIFYILTFSAIGVLGGKSISETVNTTYTQQELLIGGGLIGAGIGLLISLLISNAIQNNGGQSIIEISNGENVEIDLTSTLSQNRGRDSRREIATGNIVGKNCPYCQFPIKPNVYLCVCSECEVPHHQECWDENGGCTTYGCPNAPKR
jgi:hypothetical protein